MARILVIITLFLWLLILALATSMARQPMIALLPLYAFYPGQTVSGGQDYHPFLMNILATCMGMVFIILGAVAVLRKNKIAGVAFIVLFLISVVLILARISNDLRDLH